MSRNDCIMKAKRIPLFLFITISLFFILIEAPVSGFHGQEIMLKLTDAIFTPLPGGANYQFKVLVTYTVSNSTFVGQKINAVMKVYSGNGTLLKTTSYPAGFTANKNGTQQLLTNLAVPRIDNITTVTTFTDLNKTVALSNPVKTLPSLPLH
jgi:hypothetical protein